jgi:hypothetical protein
MDKLLLILLGIFLLLFGVFAVTNLELTWGRPVMGFAALIAGVVCLIRGIVGYTSS